MIRNAMHRSDKREKYGFKTEQKKLVIPAAIYPLTHFETD